MNALRKGMWFGIFSMILCFVGAPASAAQNTWEGFWAGMQTALIALESNPSQTYFDTLFDANFTNRQVIFEGMEARAAALTDIEVSFPIFIFEANRAAYQKVMTGTFTEPYGSGSNSLPPTNASVRLVWQGLLDANGDGKLTADFRVTDGFATFQEWGAIPLADGQAHGQVGLTPYDEGSDAALPLAADGERDGQSYEQIRELAKLLTIDANGNDATTPDFDPNLVVQQGYGLAFSEAPETRLDAAVHQENWSAGYFTVSTQPGTEIFVGNYEPTLTTEEALAIPHFAFIHRNAEGVIDLVYVNYDLLGITNQLRVDPTTFLLPPLPRLTEEELRMTEEARSLFELTTPPTYTGMPRPSATPSPVPAA